MKTKHSILSVLSALSLILSGCAKDDISGPDPDMSLEEVVLTVSVPESNASVRGLNPTDEYHIETIEVYSFSREGKFMYMTATDKIEDVPGEPGVKQFTATVPAGNIDIAITANSYEWLKDNFSVSSTTGILSPNTNFTLDNFKQRLRATNPYGGWGTDNTAADYHHMPMFGMIADVRTYPDNNNDIGTVPLYRTMAKVDVQLQNIPSNTFKLHSVRVYNANRQGHLFEDVYNSSLANVALTPHDEQFKRTIPSSQANETSITDELYLFEFNNQFDTTGSEDVRGKRICLVLGGYFENDNYLTYYRVDFREKDPNDPTQWKYLDVNRNIHYTFRITEVNERGWPEEEVAMRGEYRDIMVDITSWEEKDFPGLPL